MEPPHEQPPNLESLQPPVPSPQITAMMVACLRDTKPWVRFLSVLGFIGIGILALVALFAIAMAVFSGVVRSPIGAIEGIGLGVLYAILAGVYVIPVLRLSQYADAIGRMLTVDTVAGMEEALGRQKSFWRFVGIATVVVLIIQALAIAAAIIFAILAAARIR